MKHKLLSALLISLPIIIGSALAVLAYTYSSAFVVSNNTTTNYGIIGVSVPASNTWMAANGFFKTTALDTRIETIGGIAQPHMVADNKTLTALNVVGTSQANLLFTTGSSDLTSMAIVPGYGGYVTTADNAALEPSSNFSISFSGYVDTTAGASKYLVNKANATAIYVSPTVSGTILAEIEAATAYPTVSGNTSGNSAINTSHIVNLPSAPTAGDLLIVMISITADRTITFPSDNGTWTNLYQAINGGGLRHGAWYKVATGEGASITVTLNLSAQLVYNSYRITGYSSTPEVGVTATGTDANPNPPNVTASWGSTKNLFIAVYGSSSPANTAIPPNYLVSVTNSLSGTTSSARRELTAASDNPGTFTTSSADVWVSNTIVVKPAKISVSVSGVASGDMLVTVQSDGTNFWMVIQEAE